MTRHDLYQTQPALGMTARWRDATPLGNGLTGVAITGGCRQDAYIINRHDLWHRGREGRIPFVADAIGEMRRLADGGDLPGAQNLLYNRLCEEGYNTHGADMRTLGQVSFFHTCGGVFSRYLRCLHMDTGVAEITYLLDEKAYRRRTFVSRRRDVIVSRIESDVADGFTCQPGFYNSEEPCAKELWQRDAANLSCRVVDGCILYSTKNDDGRYFGMALCAVSNGSVTAHSEAAQHIDGRATSGGPHVEVTDATDTLVLIAAFSGAVSRQKGEGEALRRLKKTAQENYDTLLAEHARLHRRLYKSADVQLYQGRTFHSNEELLEQARQDRASVELLEKQWRFGRYLFISGTNVKGNPFPLYGLWGCGYGLPWTQHVANENVQIIHWHAAVGGLSQLIPSLVHYYYDQMATARQVARNIYGCHGIVISCLSSPGVASPFPCAPAVLHFMGVAGWLCRHFYEYYRFTCDESLLEQEILPFMLETAAFYEDYVTEKNGEVIFYPGISPENTPAEFAYYPGHAVTGHPMPVTKNPTIEIAILKELLTNLLQLAETRDIAPRRVARWREILQKLPPYRVNDDGAVAEWLDPTVTDWYFHRHLSQLYPVFPGTEIWDTGDEELLPAFRRAVELRQLGAMTGWSMAHMAAVYARLKDAEKAAETLSMLAKVCVLPNLFTLHNDHRGMGITTENHGDLNWAPVQLDAAVGAVNAMQEMLLFVSPRHVQLLPACPDSWSTGSARLSIFGGSVTMCWDTRRQTCRAEITATRDMDVMVTMPFGGEERRVQLAADQTVTLVV